MSRSVNEYEVPGPSSGAGSRWGAKSITTSVWGGGGGSWGREEGWVAGVGGAIPKDHGSQETKGRVR